MDLIFDCMERIKGPYIHPQQRMEDLGITWKQAVPQSIADQWWFYGCENVPDPMPHFLRVMRAGKEA